MFEVAGSARGEQRRSRRKGLYDELEVEPAEATSSRQAAPVLMRAAVDWFKPGRQSPSRKHSTVKEVL